MDREPHTTQRRAAIPFRFKLLAFGGTLALVPLLVLGARSLHVTRDGVKTIARELELAVATDVARSVDEQMRAAEDGLDLVGRTLTDRTLEESLAIDQAIRLVSAIEAIDHVGIYAADGSFIDAVRESALDTHRLPGNLDAETRLAANRDGATSLDPRGDEEGARILVVVPIRVDRTTSGYAASRVSLEPIARRVEQLAELRFEGVRDALFVVDAGGVVLAHSTPARVGRPLPEAARRFIETTRGRASSAAESGEYETAHGTWLATTVAVPGRPWWVVAAEPTARAYATYYSLRRFVLVTAGITALIAFASAAFLAARITRPIERLAEFANDLSRRKFDGRVTLTTRDELSLLGDAMSDAASDLAESERRLAMESSIRRDLGRYLPALLVDRVIRREHDVGLGGRRREVTVLFADVVSFTPLTEKLGAEEVVTLLNELFTVLTELVFRHGGTIDKFVGDCVMALWGAADTDPDHARRAVLAAEDMLAILETSNERWKKRFGVTIELAIGINSGECIVGNIGSESRMEYTAIGDVVNVAARLESIARPQQILVGAATRELAGPGIRFIARGERELPGRASPVTLFEVVP